MGTNETVKINLENANLVAAGFYSQLLCPKCKKKCAEVYFTKHKIEQLYGVWFECKCCGNVEHISCREKPEGFTPLRLSKKFQFYDERAWEAEK